MQKNICQGIKVTGISAAVSQKWTSLEELVEENANVGDFNLSKFIKSTGVKGKYLCAEHQTPSDLCFAAAERLLTEKKIDRSEISVVVYVTQSQDYRIPATACAIQYRLGLSNNCAAFDVNMGCSGFVYGLNIVSSVLKSSAGKKALLLCGEFAGSALDKDGNRDSHEPDVFLFGDAGSAALIEKTDLEDDSIFILSGTDGSGIKAISDLTWGMRHSRLKGRHICMDGVEVFNFAVDRAPQILKEYMNEMNSTPDDYDKLVLHQANIFIMKQVAKRSGFPLEKMSVSIDKFGNTSSAAIPLTIVNDYGDDGATEKKRLLACGFGVGLSWAAVEISISPKDVLPLVHTDEWFDDGLGED